MRFFPFVAFLALFFVLAACGDDDGGSATRIAWDEAGGDSAADKTNSIDDVGLSVKTSSGSSTVSIDSVALAVPCKGDDCEYGTLTDDRDGKTYKTVKIGNQWWMAENLNYAYPALDMTSDTSNFCYKHEEHYCGTYGRLYQWSAAMDGAGLFSTNGAGCGYSYRACSPTYPVQGVCPTGWHLPTHEEWNVLLAAVGGTDSAGLMLKSSRDWDDGFGVDAYGFSALPAGSSDNGNYFYDLGVVGIFWTSTEYYNRFAIYVSLHANSVDAAMLPGIKGDKYSVRCVMD